MKELINNKKLEDLTRQLFFHKEMGNKGMVSIIRDRIRKLESKLK